MFLKYKTFIYIIIIKIHNNVSCHRKKRFCSEIINRH